MHKYEVLVTRIKTDFASVVVTAKNEEDAEAKVREKIDPPFDENLSAEALNKRDDAARAYFDDNLNDSALNETAFEYEVSEA